MADKEVSTEVPEKKPKIEIREEDVKAWQMLVNLTIYSFFINCAQTTEARLRASI